MSAWANENWRLSGFSSIAMGRLGHSDLSYHGYDNKKWRFDGDSVLGLQLSGSLTDRLTITTQVVSRSYNHLHRNAFDPELDWLFLAYQIDSNWRLRLGRMRTPHYLYSETVDVGYSYIWARPPMDVYSIILSPFHSFDGIDVGYLTNLEDTAIDVQLFAGRIRRQNNELNIKVEPMIGGNLRLDINDFTLRYGLVFNRTNVSMDYEFLFASLGGSQNYSELYDAALNAAIALDPSFQTIKDGFSAHQAMYRYQALGGIWRGPYVTLSSELFHIKNTDSGYTNNSHGWYLSAHGEVGPFTPYLVKGYFNNDLNTDAVDVIETSFQQVPLGQPGLETFDQFRLITYYPLKLSNYGQSTWTLGVRYDAFKNVALKAEWQRIDFAAGGSGQITQKTLNPGSHTTLTTFVIDVVF